MDRQSRRHRRRVVHGGPGEYLVTHEVLNQPPPLVDYNLYEGDRVLREAVSREGAAWLVGAVTQAIHHATHRVAFGKRLVDQPLMTTVLADLALESEAA